MRLLFQLHQLLHLPPLILRHNMGSAGTPGAFTVGGSAGTPGTFMAATEPNSYDLGDDFDNKGKYEGKVYSNGNSKSNVPVYPCASHASINILSPDFPPATTSCRHSTSPINPKGSAQCNFQSLSLPFSTTLWRTPLHSCPTSFGLAQVSLLPILAQRIT
jgi:hypothetical protein